MANQETYPDHFIKTNMIVKKNKLEVIYRRNNLSIKNFTRLQSQGYSFIEAYYHKGFKITLKIHLSSTDPNDLFKIKYPKTIKIAGKKNHIGIAIKMNAALLPGEFSGTIGPVTYYFKCEGTYKCLKHTFSQPKKQPKTQKPKQKTHSFTSEIRDGKTGTSDCIPSNVRWAILHPYQGGGISPR